MKRLALQKLLTWKDSNKRLPLLVQGARQVGKTWLIQEFGQQNFSSVAYISFLNNEEAKALFEGSLDIARLVSALELYTQTQIEGANTLLVFDEIQECPRALTSLKAFREERPDIPLIAAGSLLGVAFHTGESYPVGKVDYLNMYPMTFLEFLMAAGREDLAAALAAGDIDLLQPLAETLTDLLRHYYFVGGMPEAVDEYTQTKNYDEVRHIQTRLLRDYEHDFSKYAKPELTEKIRLVWNSAPAQLARENKKFIFSAVKSGARARGYEDAINWLSNAGLLHKITRISKPGLPLAAYEDKDAFKLYVLDVGLLGAATKLDATTLVARNALFTEFKGALAENYVCQELVATDVLTPHYWSAENSSGEIDFVYDYKGEVIPVEVKAEKNLRAKSLRTFVSKYSLGKGLRLSLGQFGSQEWLIDVPLWASSLIPDML